MPEANDKKTIEQTTPALDEKLLKTRKILLSGEINKELAERVVKQLLVLDGESNDTIYLYINSPGGDVDAGYAMFDMVRYINSPVVMVGMGLVASAAALLYLAVPREKRVALPNSSYLIHQPMSGMKGVATDIEIHANHLEALKDKLNHLISEETGKPLKEVAKDTDRDYWLDAQAALAYGLVGKIITSQAEL